MALVRAYTSGLVDDSAVIQAAAGLPDRISALAIAVSGPGKDVTLSMPIGVLLVGFAFLAGFALGMAIESHNLRLRERKLARGRRLLGAQARGLREQLVQFYARRDGAVPDLGEWEFPGPDREDHHL